MGARALDAEESLDAPGLRRRSFGLALKLTLVELVVHGFEVVDVLTARLLKPAGRRARDPEVRRLWPGQIQSLPRDKGVQRSKA